MGAGRKKKGGKKLKTFNLDGDVYKEFSEYCKEQGISMSKRIESYIKKDLERMRLVRRDFVGFSEKKKTGEEHSFKKYC